MKMDCIKAVIHLFKSLRAFWKHSQMLTKMEGLLLTSRVRFFSLLSIRHQVVLVFCFNSAWFEGKQTFSSNPLGQRVPYFFIPGVINQHSLLTISILCPGSGLWENVDKHMSWGLQLWPWSNTKFSWLAYKKTYNSFMGEFLVRS